MSKITDIYARPNRRVRGQRRQGSNERRGQTIWVANCRRSPAGDRRKAKDRRPQASMDWTTVKTIKPIAARFQTVTERPAIGTVINISV